MSDGMKRRQVLIVGLGGAGAALGGLRAAAAADSRASAAYKPLFDLVDPMIKLDGAGAAARVKFDDAPTQTITDAQLSPAAWQAFLSMSPNRINAQVASERPDDTNWPKNFAAFTSGWRNCADGYKPVGDYPDCPRTKECEKKDVQATLNPEMLYAGPAPKVDSVDFKAKKILGEGFLNNAIIEIWPEGTDPTELGTSPWKTITTGISVSGTFRCSVLTFTETVDGGGKTYDVYVVNRHPAAGDFKSYVRPKRGVTL